MQVHEPLLAPMNSAQRSATSFDDEALGNRSSGTASPTSVSAGNGRLSRTELVDRADQMGIEKQGVNGGPDGGVLNAKQGVRVCPV